MFENKEKFKQCIQEISVNKQSNDSNNFTIMNWKNILYCKCALERENT